MKKVNVYSQEQLLQIQSEFSRIKDVCYLDHAGATLYSEKQMENVVKDLTSNIYANPHAVSTSSQSTIDAVDIVRYRILSFFNTSPEDYSVIFTSGATQGLKLIAETFDFNGGTLIYLEDNHTSVLGMRCFAPNCRELKIEEAFELLTETQTKQAYNQDGRNCLFVYPAQSNFAGTKYPFSWLQTAKTKFGRCYTLLDAASYVSTNPLDLCQHQPDFVTISFYKIFGYPTGLGAVLVKRSSENILRKQYFGGGTVLMALSSKNVMVPRQNIHERFEDGTLPFLAIISLAHGFETLRRLELTPKLISQHTFNLAKYTFTNLLYMHHSNGTPVAVLYNFSGFEDIQKQGGIVNFNLRRDTGEFVGYSEVMHMANLHGIHLRTGCFCNPGSCQKHLNLSSKDVQKHFEAGHVCGDQNDLVDGVPTGSVRVSFGYMTTYEDADRFLDMIEKCFVTHPVIRKRRQFEAHFYNERNFNEEAKNKIDKKEYTLPPVIKKESDLSGELQKIYLYPVKSCAAFEVKRPWKLTEIGLEYDRRWMIVNASGTCVSQKQIKNLCTLRPILDFACNALRLRINDTEMAVPLEPSNNGPNSEGFFCNSKVCGDKITGYDCGDTIAEWLSDHLEKPGLRLLRQCDFNENIAANKQFYLLPTKLNIFLSTRQAFNGLEIAFRETKHYLTLWTL
ncbi:unnamed protein product [Ceutorhynchus assimilis]|uniref:Molybdenum cofactor sulfurase n=1 Tax=Ceutorhynchus assimilis TaxID=467358 RepID=A0A9P0DD47_9CUCU|nr:unnamed protein product [Ceutorhynchus assimilis]